MFSKTSSLKSNSGKNHENSESVSKEKLLRLVSLVREGKFDSISPEDIGSAEIS